jgi:hypothetical protein
MARLQLVLLFIAAAAAALAAPTAAAAAACPSLTAGEIVRATRRAARRACARAQPRSAGAAPTHVLVRLPVPQPASCKAAAADVVCGACVDELFSIIQNKARTRARAQRA